MIKRTFFCTFVAFHFMTCAHCAYSQDMNQLDFNFGAEGGAHYFDFEETDYGTYVKTPDNPRYVSDQEFENAIKTKEKYGMTYKQRKRAEKKRKRRHMEEQEHEKQMKMFDKSSPLALLRLPVTISIDNKVLYPGFYLLDYRVLEGNTVIDVFQGSIKIGSLIADNIEKQPSKVRSAYTQVQYDEQGNVIVILNTSKKIIKCKLSPATPEDYE